MALNREQIVQTALAVVEAVGLDELTMRALAKALEVQAPTLYWHIPSKQGLLNEMANAIVASVASSVSPDGDWNDVLRNLAVALRSTLLEQRDGGRIFAGTYALGPNVLHLAEIALAALHRSGADPRTANYATFNLINFVVGSVIEEQSFHTQFAAADVEALRGTFLQAAKAFPIITANIDVIFDTDFEDRFRMGIAMCIAGLEQTAGFSAELVD